MRFLPAVTLLLAAAGVGCVRAGDFHCSSDADCILAGAQGRCEVVTYCSFPDSQCASGSRFGAQSGAFAGTCVGSTSSDDAGVDTLPDDTGTDASTFAFSDQFDAGSLQWTVLSGTWAAAAGVYRQSSTAFATMTVAGSSWSDLTVEAKALIHSGTEDIVRVMFRFVDSSNFEAGFFSKFYGAAGLEQVVGGTRTFSQSPFAPVFGQTYAVKIVVSGSTATLSINGTPIHTRTMPAGGPATGKIGLSTDASDVSFDDVFVTLP